MLTKHNLRSHLVTLMLVAGFCGSILSHSAHISAQDTTPAAADTCTADTGNDQNENEADDATESNCDDEQGQDEGACVLIGADPTAAVDDQADGETNDDAIATQEATVDDHADGEANDDGDDQADGEANDDGDVQNPDATEEPAYNGSIAVDETIYAAMTTAERCAALTKLATITPEEAQAAAEVNATGVVQTVEIDAENGSLIYSVEMDDDSSVKVDAGNGAVLATEAASTDDHADGEEND